MKSTIAAFLSLGFIASPSIAEEAKIVCKKRHPQVYSAFYRTEVITAKDGQMRFEYGIGDSTQIYELYYFAQVTRTSEDVYETADGVTPHLRVEIRQGRKSKELNFALIDSAGVVTKRNGYRCE